MCKLYSNCQEMVRESRRVHIDRGRAQLSQEKKNLSIFLRLSNAPKIVNYLEK